MKGNDYYINRLDMNAIRKYINKLITGNSSKKKTSKPVSYNHRDIANFRKFDKLFKGGHQIESLIEFK